MIKTDFIADMAHVFGLSIDQARACINTILGEMEAAIVDGRSIEFRGFGSFAIKQHDAYVGRNPKTGLPIEVPAKRAIRFRLSNEIRRELIEQKPTECRLRPAGRRG
jgi:integration host factor subunit beta